MSRPNLAELHARAKVGIPDWQGCSFARMPPGGPTLYFEVEGAVYPTLSRGPRKGKPAWRKPVAGTERTVYIPVDEHEAWVKNWEQETGNCRHCVGTGERFASGVKMRKCLECDGTGKAAGEPAGVAS